MNEKKIYSTTVDRYAQAEKDSPSKYTRRCIDGKLTGCGNCVGYCQFEDHPGFLTKQLRKEHNCIAKNCNYYIAKPSKKNRQRPY